MLTARSVLAALALFTLAAPSPALAQAAQPANAMSFFISSVGSGRGANLGGLLGADKHCQTLAAAAGAGNRTWRAYLSAVAAGNQPAVNAKDRIGNGPWTNAKGVVIAKSVADLHSDANNLKKDTALTEKGTVVNGVGDMPNQHDILTGSQPDGRAFPAGKDMTCNNYTSNGEGTVMVGHHDRIGGPNASWNAVHASKGCSQPNLIATGGNAYLYCFAEK